MSSSFLKVAFRILSFTIFTLAIHPSLLADVSSIERVIKQIPGYRPDIASLKPIGGGATNHNYILNLSNKRYFIKDTSLTDYELLGMRNQELLCTQIAASKGFSPSVVLADREAGVMIFDFVESNGKFSVKERESLKNLAHRIRDLHQSGIIFPSTFDPILTIKGLYGRIQTRSISLPPEVESKILPYIEHLGDSLQTTASCPCHLDLHSRNVLDDGKNIWIIDWECASMADPLFDLATLASIENFDESQTLTFLTAYYETPKQEIFDRLKLLRILSDTRWLLWCYLQQSASTIDFPYDLVAARYLSQCLQGIEAAKN
ncbi:MAG: choline/ethanolamine kinase family protein [Waddliaceae bacterium]